MVPLIEIKGLTTSFHTEDGVCRALDGVDFSINPEQTLGVVGESGCGKSVTALSIMRLIPTPPGRIERGEILFRHNGQSRDLVKLVPNGRTMRSIRGNEIAMIFQEPMTSLNPLFTIGRQIMEAIVLHQGLGKIEARNMAIEMLRLVGIPSPERRIEEYPHQLSGGMRQRAMIAMALSCHPALLIADEPTTALDVTIQAQVLNLMQKLQEEFKAAIMFITHDLGVIANIADEVVVMYMGRIVEHAGAREIFSHPAHPYTKGLINSIPAFVNRHEKRLMPISGVVPDPYDVLIGCSFESRCPYAMDRCREAAPPLVEAAPQHWSACWVVGQN